MNMAEDVLVPFSAEEIAEARKLALSRESTVTAALDELAGLPAEAFAVRLGATLHYPIATMEDLHRWTPAFELLPFGEALRAQMLLFRDDEAQLRMVLADPLASCRASAA